jgi:hypothetical protein
VSERKIRAWSNAGLIDEATVARIRDWEAKNARPLGLWALVGLGALAIGLGLVSVVAANWDAIPGLVRLSIHFSLIAGLTGFIIWQHDRAATLNTYFHDAFLFILGALGLTFFGHIGQVYQMSSPLWQPLGLWLVLFSPLLLGSGRGWLAAAMWLTALCYAAYEHWGWYLARDLIVDVSSPGPRNSHTLYMGIVSSLPAFVMALAALMRARSDRPDFWRRLEKLGIMLIAWGVTGLQLAYAYSSGRETAQLEIAGIQAACLIVAAAAVRLARPTRSGTAAATILTAGAVTLLLATGVHTSSIGAGLLFLIFWGAIAGAALFAGWRIVFQVSVAMLALRLIILSFELANDLLGSGLGLILAGAATLGIAWIAVRISKRFAPKGEAA